MWQIVWPVWKIAAQWIIFLFTKLAHFAFKFMLISDITFCNAIFETTRCRTKQITPIADMWCGKKRIQHPQDPMTARLGRIQSRIPGIPDISSMHDPRFKGSHNNKKMRYPRSVGSHCKSSGQDPWSTRSFKKMAMKYATSIKILDLRPCVFSISFHTYYQKQKKMLQEGHMIHSVDKRRTVYNCRRSTWVNEFSWSKIHHPQDPIEICLNKIQDPSKLCGEEPGSTGSFDKMPTQDPGIRQDAGSPLDLGTYLTIIH